MLHACLLFSSSDPILTGVALTTFSEAAPGNFNGDQADHRPNIATTTINTSFS